MFYIREYMGISYFAIRSESGTRKYQENKGLVYLCVNRMYQMVCNSNDCGRLAEVSVLD